MEIISHSAKHNGKDCLWQKLEEILSLPEEMFPLTTFKCGIETE